MTTVPMWSTFRAIDSRAGQRAAALPLLSVSQYRGVVRRSEIDSADARAEDLSLYKTCRPGDLVLNRMSAYKGAVGVAKVEGLVSPDYLVMRPTNAALPEFLAFLIKTPWFVGQMTRLVRGIGSVEGSNVRTPRIGASELGSIKIDLPPLGIQKEVVKFLDRGTAEIDAFIADQQDLIELLAERRAATIHHAVTKGLDPTAPMIDAGLEWVGKMPKEWTTRKVGNLFGLIGSGTTPPKDGVEYYGSGVPWVTTGELRESRITSTRQTVNALAMRDFTALRVYPKGSILVAMYGATVGRLGVLGVDATTNQACCAFAYPRGVRSEFVYFALQAAKDHLLTLADGGGQPNINQEKLRQLRLPIPSMSEQGTIVARLKEETSVIDAAIADAREAIAVSRERRASLISAAVTGKIDARVAA